MMRAEFEKLIGKEVSQKDYDLIEFIYTWHPAINHVNGKTDIVEIYNKFGMVLIRDMKNTATKAKELECELLSIRAREAEIEEQLEQLTM